MADYRAYLLATSDVSATLAALRAAVQQCGYQLYDPFDAPTSRAYVDTLKAFIAPVEAGWLRILGTLPDAILMPFSADHPALEVRLHPDGAAQLNAWRGQSVDPLPVLQAYRRPEVTAEQLEACFHAEQIGARPTRSGGVPVEMLPDDLQRMAQGIESQHIEQMFNKFMRQINKRLGVDPQQTQAVLAPTRVNWERGGGRWLREVLACLTVPVEWHSPDFSAVRDAYQLWRRTLRNPNAPLYPGDGAALAAVPNVEQFIPFYAGKER